MRTKSPFSKLGGRRSSGAGKPKVKELNLENHNFLLTSKQVFGSPFSTSRQMSKQIASTEQSYKEKVMTQIKNRFKSKDTSTNHGQSVCSTVD